MRRGLALYFLNIC